MFFIRPHRFRSYVCIHKLGPSLQLGGAMFIMTRKVLTGLNSLRSLILTEPTHQVLDSSDLPQIRRNDSLNTHTTCVRNMHSSRRPPRPRVMIFANFVSVCRPQQAKILPLGGDTVRRCIFRNTPCGLMSLRSVTLTNSMSLRSVTFNMFGGLGPNISTSLMSLRSANFKAFGKKKPWVPPRTSQGFFTICQRRA